MDGASFAPAYQPPKYPTEDLEGGEHKGLMTYTGSCHCGRVMIAVRSEPLADVEVLECDCSICGRVRVHLGSIRIRSADASMSERHRSHLPTSLVCYGPRRRPPNDLSVWLW